MLNGRTCSYCVHVIQEWTPYPSCTGLQCKTLPHCTPPGRSLGLYRTRLERTDSCPCSPELKSKIRNSLTDGHKVLTVERQALQQRTKVQQFRIWPFPNSCGLMCVRGLIRTRPLNWTLTRVLTARPLGHLLPLYQLPPPPSPVPPSPVPIVLFVGADYAEFCTHLRGCSGRQPLPARRTCPLGCFRFPAS